LSPFLVMPYRLHLQEEADRSDKLEREDGLETPEREEPLETTEEAGEAE